MILVKNKLKKIKNTIDDEEMLNYLKYSHLEPIREDDVLKINTSNKSTQAPDIMNNFSQTDKKVMMDKETDTYDELNVIDPPYYLTMTSRNVKSKEPSRAEKMAHVWATTVEQNTPPTSNSEDGDGSEDPSGRSRDDEGLMSRNLNRGLRVAQLTGSAMLTALNITDTVAGAILNPVIGGAIDYFLTNPSTEQNEDEQNEEIPSSSVDIPQHAPRDRSRSRDSGDDTEGASGQSRDDTEGASRQRRDVNMGHRLLQRGASRSRDSSRGSDERRSITPSSGTASSAKTTPRKKSK